MELALSSRPRPTYAHVPSVRYDVMADMMSGGIVASLDSTIDDVNLPFVPVTIPTERRSRPYVTKQLRNATFVIGLVSSMSFLETMPTVAADPVASWLSGWRGTVASNDTLQTFDGFFEPVGGSQHLAVLNDRIDRFVSLPAGWDGDDGVAPSQVAGVHSKAFLISLKTVNLPHECHAVGDGEIVLQWRGLDSFIEAAFDGSTVSWYAQIGTGAATYSDDVFVNAEAVDKRLTDAIDLIG
jgi:hypothetical protein